jgi:GntP family gluconate:H+ symporter
MDPLLAFLAAIILVSLIIPRMGAFLSLILAAIFFGLLVGMGSQLMGYVALGLGRIFSSLAIVVFSGALLAEYLRRTRALLRIVSDLRALTRHSLLAGGAAGYLISLPVMCSITAYMILEPVVSGLADQEGKTRKRALFMTAVCSVISFNLVYPSPVMVSLSNALDARPYDLLMRGIPISLVLFALACIIMMRLSSEEEETVTKPEDSSTAALSHCRISRAGAWAPLLLPFILILLGGWREETRILANPGLALLFGAMLGLFLAGDMMQELIHVAMRRSGTILLDLCGAGAFGYVVAESGLGEEIYRNCELLPLLLLPFLVSSVLQLAQGSRVVTAVVAAQILAEYPLDAITLSLLIAAGAFMLSSISDPYFWLISSSTGASTKETLKGYTLPLSLLGLFAFVLAAISSML